MAREFGSDVSEFSGAPSLTLSIKSIAFAMRNQHRHSSFQAVVPPKGKCGNYPLHSTCETTPAKEESACCQQLNRWGNSVARRRAISSREFFPSMSSMTL